MPALFSSAVTIVEPLMLRNVQVKYKYKITKPYFIVRMYSYVYKNRFNIARTLHLYSWDLIQSRIIHIIIMKVKKPSDSCKYKL